MQSRQSYPRGVRATLEIELRDACGRVLARRRRRNTVLQTGATLLADLFRGVGGPINRMAVGAHPEAEVTPFATSALLGAGLEGATEVEVTADDFVVEISTDDLETRLTARIVLPAGAEGEALSGAIAEAALLHLAEDGTRRLYNRVTFESIDKEADQELSLYWELHFPFGDLH